jgi:hypothetical protein
MVNEFFRLKRAPAYRRDKISIPFTQDLFRRFTFLPDWNNTRHRQEVSWIARVLIERDRRLQMLAYWALEKAGATKIIHAFFGRRPSSSFQPDLVDLYYLYAHIRAQRPQVVLEFGCGVSTAVMAFALAQNGSGHLYAVDASPDWSNSTAEAIPDDLKSFVSTEAIDSEPAEVFGVASYRFKTLPVDRADMIYIDGAASEHSAFQGAENLEQIDLKPRTSIYIDCRFGAVDYFLRRREKDASLGYEISAYDVLMGNYHPSVRCPFGMDYYSNTLVQIN